MRVVALDYGEKRVGVAVSDPLGKTAQPHSTLPNDDSLLGELSRIAAELEADSFVVGLPVLMDGTQGAQALRARRFAERLAGDTGIKVEMIDERLTTRQAETVIGAGPVSSDKGASDRVAAALILKSYLERKDGE